MNEVKIRAAKVEDSPQIAKVRVETWQYVYKGQIPDSYLKASLKDVELVWKDLLKDSHLNPSDMHSILWNWSRAKFIPEV